MDGMENAENVETIEKEFKESETLFIRESPQTIVYGERKWYHFVFLLLWFIGGSYIFYYFLPLEFGTKALWNGFKTNCCGKDSYGVLCSIRAGCGSQLVVLTRSVNMTITDIYKECCFYMANLETPWILLPFVSTEHCYYKCLSQYLSISQ